MRLRDVYDGFMEIWKKAGEKHSPHNWFELCGRSKNPAVYRPIIERFLKEVEIDNIQTMEILIAANCFYIKKEAEFPFLLLDNPRIPSGAAKLA